MTDSQNPNAPAPPQREWTSDDFFDRFKRDQANKRIEADKKKEADRTE